MGVEVVESQVESPEEGGSGFSNSLSLVRQAVQYSGVVGGTAALHF